ncbi:uncharacterized protein MONBRDRAFT_36889 [Monosiga brevicollis MX1]|uniref:WW domain-containing protein n=1 Tax=Monosiga brevicollis TaxID=81824 RepID=A9UXJ7_MONBE|nr:uncharacterized protein MONBRDRAFT_36889 [Monosiga brevicollis MX1]EDQ89854.1 predicted protein [Monosiga brevicollis MX1]|eukprot:XP_001745276.1 hypothetical protein [Monosiga brevicollis MX1]
MAGRSGLLTFNYSSESEDDGNDLDQNTTAPLTSQGPAQASTESVAIAAKTTAAPAQDSVASNQSEVEADHDTKSETLMDAEPEVQDVAPSPEPQEAATDEPQSVTLDPNMSTEDIIAAYPLDDLSSLWVPPSPPRPEPSPPPPESADNTSGRAAAGLKADRVAELKRKALARKQCRKRFDDLVLRANVLGTSDADVPEHVRRSVAMATRLEDFVAGELSLEYIQRHLLEYDAYLTAVERELAPGDWTMTWSAEMGRHCFVSDTTGRIRWSRPSSPDKIDA